MGCIHEPFRPKYIQIFNIYNNYTILFSSYCDDIAIFHVFWDAYKCFLTLFFNYDILLFIRILMSAVR